MSKAFENRSISKEQIVHDLTLEVVRTSIASYQQGNDFQVSDVDIARYATNIYDECYPIIMELTDKK